MRRRAIALVLGLAAAGTVVALSAGVVRARRPRPPAREQRLLRAACHQLTHRIGRAGGAIGGMRVFDDGDPLCSSGSYHRDFAQVFRLCSRIERAFRGACYRALGGDIVVDAAKHLFDARARALSRQRLCLLGAETARQYDR